MSERYLSNIIARFNKQKEKGINKYGKTLEDNPRGGLEALEYLEELKEKLQESHSEKEIINGCIALMESVHQNMLEYMDVMGFEYDVENKEEIPQFRYSYFEIIQRLLLKGTSYSGGTSTRKKCEQLGLDSYEEIIIGE